MKLYSIDYELNLTLPPSTSHRRDVSLEFEAMLLSTQALIRGTALFVTRSGVILRVYMEI